MTLCSYAFSYCSAPGAPLCQARCVDVGMLEVHSLRRSCFSRLGKWFFVQCGVAFMRFPMERSAASCLCPGRSHGQTGALMISSGFAHFSHTSFLRIVRAGIASPCAIKMYSELHPETDEYDQISSCLRPSFDLSTDPLDTTLGVPEHASAHAVSAASPTFERHLLIGPNRVQVQQRCGVPN